MELNISSVLTLRYSCCIVRATIIIGEVPYIIEEVPYGTSILCEMPIQKRNERRQEYNHEKWQASDSGCLPDMWDKDVQDREELEQIF